MARQRKNNKAILACGQCMERNYSFPKSQSLLNDRLELKKYCPRCSSHTLHRETR